MSITSFAKTRTITSRKTQFLGMSSNPVMYNVIGWYEWLENRKRNSALIKKGTAAFSKKIMYG